MNDDLWAILCEELIQLGWTPATTDGIDGLSSPSDAAFVAPRNVTGSGRELLRSVLRRKVNTLQADIDSGVTPREQGEPALADFQQLLTLIERE